jgi:FtsZ-interacting cell division protein ZipA
MSDLQLGLLGVGAAVVVGVLGYNKWQERRYRRQAESGFRSRYEDVLMRSETGAEAAPVAARNRVEPVLGAAGAAVPGGLEVPAPVLSETTEFIVPVEASVEIPGASVLDAAAEFPVTVLWEGFDEDRGSWEMLRPERMYSRLRAGLQLVDRRGTANADELAEFSSWVQEVAVAAGAQAAVPDLEVALARAEELDAFCSDVDIRIGVNIVSTDAAFPGAEIKRIAEAAGFVLEEGEGLFELLDDSGRVLCTLADIDGAPFRAGDIGSATTLGLTLELDVPRASRGAFERFRDLAQDLSGELDARIVDDNRQPLGAAAFDAIGARMDAVHASMEARGIRPGGALALRLFS